MPIDRSRPDWWVPATPLLVAADLALYLTLQARPGAIAIILWYFGPPTLAVLATGLLVGVLLSSLRPPRGTAPSRSRVVAYAGLVGLVASVPLYRVYPSSHDSRPSEARYRLPLGGPVTAAWGGAAPDENYHVFLPDQRWAYDLLVTKDGVSYHGNPAELRSYYAYDLPVLAPASGTVVRVHDGEPDARIGRRWWSLRTALGNHLVLAVGPGDPSTLRQAQGPYLFIAHLRPGSVRVREGERVRAGTPIGRVGNSGNSSEPHVHLHLQDTPRPFFGEAIPFQFSGYREGGRVVDAGMPPGGIRRGRHIGAVVEHVR